MHRASPRPSGRPRLGRALALGVAWLALSAPTLAQTGFAPGDPPLPAAAAAPWTEAVAAVDAALASPLPWTPDAPAWRAALGALGRTWTAAPDHPAVVRASLRAYVEVGWWVRAVAALEALTRVRPDDPWADPADPVGRPEGGAPLATVAAAALREYGFARYQAVDLDAAQAAFARWVALFPDDPDAHRWLGRVLLERADPAAALPHLERWAELRPADADAAYFVQEARQAARYGVAANAAFRRGLAAHAAGDLADAAAAFDEARAFAPDHAEAHAWAGRVALERGDPAAAVPAFEAALALRPDDAGWAYFLRVAEVGRDVGPAAADAYFAGLAAYEQGRLDDAAARFAEAIAANPGFVDGWVWRARTLQETGATVEAEAAWSRVVELDPEDARARFFRDRLREQLAYGRDVDPSVVAAFVEGVAAFEAADLATARARFEVVVAADPGSGLAWSWLGRVTYTARDFAAAAVAYARAAELLPDDPDVAWFAEDAAFRAGDGPAPEDGTTPGVEAP